MWRVIVDVIFRKKLLILIVLGIITVFMGYHARKVKLSHEFVRMLPETDSTSIAYENFKKIFGEDGTVMYIGIADTSIYSLSVFSQWYDIAKEIEQLEGVINLMSVAQIYVLEKDEKGHKFKTENLFKEKPHTQMELDSLYKKMFGLKFYEGLLFNSKTASTVMALTLEKEIINSEARNAFIRDIKKQFEDFENTTGIKVHYSGLPYIRTITSKKIEKELMLFIVLALIVAAIALFAFFRSVKAVFFPILVVCVSVVWVLGLISLFNYKITILSGIIPPLLIVIGVENCIYLLNKYHNEYIRCKNKYTALSQIVVKIGNALLMTNLTTAIGFSTFMITHNQLLVEFGIIASISIMLGFVLSILLIPIIFNYLKPPQIRHLKHLENKNIKAFSDFIIFTVMRRRKLVFVITIVLLVAGVFGVSRLTTSGRIVDDIPKTDEMYKDLVFFENNYKGIMPLEISIDTKKKNGVKNIKNIKKIDALQTVLQDYKNLSRSLSVADLLKFAKQSFYNGNPERYELPSKNELAFILRYVPDMGKNNNKVFSNFVDDSLRITRVSVQMANITTKEITAFSNMLKPQIDSIFNPDEYKVEMTGTSMVFLKGTTFLVHNLIRSLIFAILLIALLMALVFSSFRMIIVSMIPNLVPQLLTAAMMGYLGIPIKPSTILIFSIAFGISIDNSIHFLAKYRMELKQNGFNIKKSIVMALRETGVSMLYSSFVLFFGFAIFTASSFGGTQALGFLISFTLLVALFSNLFLLPSILLSWENYITTKAFYKRKAILELEH